MAKGHVKIGFTNGDTAKRIKEINSGTGVIGEWKLVKSWHVSNARNVEQFIHKKLKEIRTQNNREFFQIDENEAVLKIEEIMKSIGHKEGKYWVITSEGVNNFV